MSAAPILTILKDGETVRSVPIEDEALLGRDEGCVIRLEDRMISRQHALFRRRGDQIQVEKKSEFAPLLVNGSDCTTAVLKDGDVISIGPYLVKLSLERQQAAASNALPAAPAMTPASAAAAAPSEMPALTLEAVGDAHPAEAAAAEVPALTLEAPAELEAPLPDLGAALEEVTSDNAVGLQPEEPVASPGGVTLEPLEDAPNLSLQSAEAAEAPQPILSAQGGFALEDPTRVVATSGPQFQLIFKPGDANVLDYNLDKDEIFIGRGKDCDVVLTDKKVSRKNAHVFRSGNVISIKDLESANGTYVNGKKITETVLSGGDKIKIGEAEFEFRADQPGYSEQEKDFLAVPPVVEASGPVELPPFQMEGGGMPMLSSGAEAVAIPSPMGIPGVGDPAGDLAADPNAGIAGIAGVSGGKKKSLIEKFRTLPKTRQWIVIGLVVAFGYFFFLDDEDDTQQPNQKQVQMNKGSKSKKKGQDSADQGSKMARPFSALNKDKQDFVRTQHKLAFEYFQHQDYANALAAIKPIFEYVDDYEDSRLIQQYAEDGLRQMKVIAEEKAKKEAEEAKVRKITDLINKGRDLMSKKKYADATSVFNDILVIDPENAQVAQWQTKIREYEEDLRIEAQKKQVQAEVSNQAWAVYKEGVAIRRRGELRKALSVLDKVKEIGAVDARPARLAAEEMKKIRDEIRTQLEPVLKEGKEKEDAQDYPGAMVAYTKALSIEPSSAEADGGITRVKAILNDRAKLLYTEAVLAESYSDFSTAKKKFQQCSETAPKDSLYHDRAIRKLARYFKAADELMPAGGQ